MARRRRFRLPPHLSPMKDYRNWVLWGYDENDKKVPEQVHRNRRASTTDPDTWADYEDARDVYNDGFGDGLGFVLKGTPIVGLDFDDVEKDGESDPVAQRLIDRLPPTYFERTPSGFGWRGLGLGDGDPVHTIARRFPGGGKLEVYFDTARYITVSGDVLYSRPLAPLGAFLREIRSTAARLPEKASTGRAGATAAIDISGFETLDAKKIIRELHIPTNLTGMAGDGRASEVLWKAGRTAHEAGASPREIAAVLYNSKAFMTHCRDMDSEQRLAWLAGEVARIIRKGPR
jgi:hypothetical protein